MKKILTVMIIGLAAPAFAAETLNGAGASFPYPVYSGWAYSFEKESGVRVNYQSIGSGGGVKQITAGTVDFGASDDPLSQADLDQAGLMQFPAVTGGIVVVVNIDGNRHNNLVLNGETLAAIFLGEVTRWNDPEIAALNPELKLPDEKITVIRRSDSSGTTAVFTEYLSKVSPEWKAAVGSGKSVNWKTGIGAKGNDGVANMVRQTRNSIGFTEYTYAEQAKLNYTALINSAGKVVSPTPQTFAAAVAAVDWHENAAYAVSLTDSPAADAWPIAAATFVLIRKNEPEIQARVMEFFRYGFEKGDTAALYLKYVPLPDSLKTEILTAFSVPSDR